MKEKSKNALYVLAAIGVTIIGFVIGLWLVWAVVITLMFVESLVSNLKLWVDDKESRYLDALQKTRSDPAETLELLHSMQMSLTRLEKRLEALEKR
jgi:fatty acid desaturase